MRILSLICLPANQSAWQEKSKEVEVTTMTSERAFCKCGRDLGSKRTDLPTEHVTRGTCPHCHKKYVIIYGKGKVKVRMEK